MKNKFKMAFFRLAFCFTGSVVHILSAKLAGIDVEYVEVLTAVVIVMFISEPLFNRS